MLSWDGLPPRAMLHFDKRLADISVVSLRAKAMELLRPGTYLQVIPYPEGWGEPGRKVPSTVSD